VESYIRRFKDNIDAGRNGPAPHSLDGLVTADMLDALTHISAVQRIRST
jgi:hypothetical protein